MYHRILVPLDGSKQSESALYPASQFARINQAEITLLRVVEYPYEIYPMCESSTFMNPGQPDEKLLAEKAAFCREAEDYLKSLLPMTELPVSKVSMEVRECPVVDAILRATKTLEIDLIVMSAVGQGRSPWRIGAVANRILRESLVPVILVGNESYSDQFELVKQRLIESIA